MYQVTNGKGWDKKTRGKGCGADGNRKKMHRGRITSPEAPVKKKLVEKGPGKGRSHGTKRGSSDGNQVPTRRCVKEKRRGSRKNASSRGGKASSMGKNRKDGRERNPEGGKNWCEKRGPGKHAPRPSRRERGGFKRGEDGGGPKALLVGQGPTQKREESAAKERTRSQDYANPTERI